MLPVDEFAPTWRAVLDEMRVTEGDDRRVGMERHLVRRRRRRTRAAAATAALSSALVIVAFGLSTRSAPSSQLEVRDSPATVEPAAGEPRETTTTIQSTTPPTTQSTTPPTTQPATTEDAPPPATTPETPPTSAGPAMTPIGPGPPVGEDVAPAPVVVTIDIVGEMFVVRGASVYDGSDGATIDVSRGPLRISVRNPEAGAHRLRFNGTTRVLRANDDEVVFDVVLDPPDARDYVLSCGEDGHSRAGERLVVRIR